MIYTENLPRIDVLSQLVSKLDRFPESAYHIGDMARHLGYSQEIITFIRLFDPHHVFSSKKEFLDSCEELEMLLYDASHLQESHLLNQQD